MNVTELRVGNWVFEGKRLIHIHDGFGIDHSINFNPIPLTEEWLLKFGFLKYKGNNKDFWLNDFEFANDLKWIFWKGNILENIEYVHQLQNLYFALTQTELKYDN